MKVFFINSKRLLKHVFMTKFLCFNRSFDLSENKIKRHMIDYIPWLHNVTESFKKILNSKRRAKLKIQSQRYRHAKDENSVLPKE